MRTFAFTGHRPKDLPEGFGFRQVGMAIRDFIDSEGVPPSDFVTGGALGIDSWAAEYAIERMIPLHLFLPFEPEVMARFWRDPAVARLQRHIAYATTLHITQRGAYDVRAYQKRNEQMVDAADLVLAFWTGKKFGGTANCIRYAESVGKPVVNLFHR